MKKYIGERLIEAEPMNLWDAVKKRLCHSWR